MKKYKMRLNLKNHKVKVVLILLCFFLIHCVIFHKVIHEIPSILKGDSVIARDELIPFFNFDSQFFDQITGGASSLTSTDEIRISYSFWTSWVRYSPILPFALVILNTISAFILFFSIYIITKRFYKNEKYIYLASFLAALAIHLILLYSKITHFYTLIFGFSIFALAVSLTLKEFFYEKVLSIKEVILISLLILFNPAIHYHILYYITLLLLVIFRFLFDRGDYSLFLKKNLRNILFIFLFSFIPYVLLILYVSNASTIEVSNSIPVNYWSIAYASTPLAHLITFGIAAPIDMFQHGFYLIPIPRYANAILLLVTLIVFFLKNKLSNENQRLTLVMYSIFLFSIFMSIGYEYGLSFHGLLATLMEFLANIHNKFVDIFERLINVSIQILRFPQRFTFISFYFIGVLLSISLVALANRFKFRFSYLLIILLVILPFASNNDYRKVFSSGDYNKFLTPLKVPDDLKEIKKIVTNNPGQLFVLPTMESGRDLVINENRYNFIDKFLIYYLNTPTFYYGTSARTENKVYASAVYQSILNEETWWERILDQSLNIEYIIQPNTQDRVLGRVYLSAIDLKIQQALSTSSIFKKVYDGNNFSLYKRSKSSSQINNILVDLPFDKTGDYLKLLKHNDEHIFFPLETNKFIQSEGEKFIYTDDPQRAYYDILNASDRAYKFLPSSKLVPFTDQLVSSGFYTNLPLSFSTLLDEDNPYNFLYRIVPDIINLNTSQFIATAKSSVPIEFSFHVPRGEYTLYLKASFEESTVKAIFNDLDIKFNKITNIAKNENTTNFAYFQSEGKIDFDKGTIKFFGAKDNSLIVESLMFVPEELNFLDTKDILGSEEIQLLPSQTKSFYKLK